MVILADSSLPAGRCFLSLSKASLRLCILFLSLSFAFTLLILLIEVLSFPLLVPLVALLSLFLRIFLLFISLDKSGFSATVFCWKVPDEGPSVFIFCKLLFNELLLVVTTVEELTALVDGLAGDWMKKTVESLSGD